MKLLLPVDMKPPAPEDEMSDDAYTSAKVNDDAYVRVFVDLISYNERESLVMTPTRDGGGGLRRKATG